MFTMRVKEVIHQLRMPNHIFKRWRESGTLNGIKHPEYKTRAGRNLFYNPDEINHVQKLLPADMFQKPKQMIEVWTAKTIADHGQTELLACATLRPVYVRGRQSVFMVSVTDDIKNDAKAAHDVLGRRAYNLNSVKRIESNRLFPGVQFKVERVK